MGFLLAFPSFPGIIRLQNLNILYLPSSYGIPPFTHSCHSFQRGCTLGNNRNTNKRLRHYWRYSWLRCGRYYLWTYQYAYQTTPQARFAPSHIPLNGTHACGDQYVYSLVCPIHTQYSVTNTWTRRRTHRPSNHRRIPDLSHRLSYFGRYQYLFSLALYRKKINE